MTMRISLLCSALFVILLFTGNYLNPIGKNSHPDADVEILYTISMFILFFFGIASCGLSLSSLWSFRNGEDQRGMKAFPIIWFLIWREVKDEIDAG